MSSLTVLISGVIRARRGRRPEKVVRCWPHGASVVLGKFAYDALINKQRPVPGDGFVDWSDDFVAKRQAAALPSTLHYWGSKPKHCSLERGWTAECPQRIGLAW